MKACTYFFVPYFFLNIGQHNFLFLVKLNKSSDKTFLVQKQRGRLFLIEVYLKVTLQNKLGDVLPKVRVRYKK